MHLTCDHLHQPNGWLSPGTLTIDPLGRITAITPGAIEGSSRVRGITLPGMSNLHSHAFQRALGGFVQQAGPDKIDSFWTWREAMYRVALQITPDDLRTISAQLYLEMLEAGYTAVGEFHYVHNQPDGRPYDSPTAMSTAVINGANAAGIAMTLLPVAYFSGGFGVDAEPQQRRFVHENADAYCRLWTDLAALCAESKVPLGVAPHSLRAVPAPMLNDIIATTRGDDPETRIHMHVAEQPQEVEQAKEFLGASPVRWLIDNQPVDANWCLIHATHIDADEMAQIAARQPVVGLCPSTEADLGDGLFPAAKFRSVDGRWGIGSDAHTMVSVSRELALLEWGQRLQRQRRLVLADPNTHIGRGLFDGAARDGADALDHPIGELRAGHRADFVVLNAEHPRLVGLEPNAAIDAWIFSGADDAVDEVWVAGQKRVESGRHIHRDRIQAEFAATMRRLARAL
ncbi:MAG: formimidoylglutamate deiminase [Myxococcota bacterium]